MARKRRPSFSNRASAILGGVLLVVGFLWLGWILLGQHGGTPSFANISLPGVAPTNGSETQIPSLQAEGITLGHSDQTPTLNQQQAVLLASQLEPDAATQAKSTTARFVLLNYVRIGTSATATQANLNNVPVWMIWYQQIPLQPANAAVDPTPFPHSTHDLYVFLDATSGKEVLSVWI